MIHGDDFFEKGYSILTKNMPSNWLILNRDSEIMALNLVLNLHKISIFASIISNAIAKNKYYLLSNFNNRPLPKTLQVTALTSLTL